MREQGYNRCRSDHYAYFKRLDDGSYIILLLYVDDAYCKVQHAGNKCAQNKIG